MYPIRGIGLIRLECYREIDLTAGAGLEAARVPVTLPLLTRNVCLLDSARTSSPLDTPKGLGRGYFSDRRAFDAQAAQ
jgi:hypothetical protein